MPVFADQRLGALVKVTHGGTVEQAGVFGPVLAEADDSEQNGVHDGGYLQHNHVTGGVQAASEFGSAAQDSDATVGDLLGLFQSLGPSGCTDCRRTPLTRQIGRSHCPRWSGPTERQLIEVTA